MRTNCSPVSFPMEVTQKFCWKDPKFVYTAISMVIKTKNEWFRHMCLLWLIIFKWSVQFHCRDRCFGCSSAEDCSIWMHHIFLKLEFDIFISIRKIWAKHGRDRHMMPETLDLWNDSYLFALFPGKISSKIHAMTWGDIKLFRWGRNMTAW